MHRLRSKPVLILVVVGALAAGGAAYTNSISGAGTTSNRAAYDGVTVQGATLNDAAYSFDTTGANITGVTLTFGETDLVGDEVKAGFGTDALTDCGPVSAGDTGASTTTVTCTFGSPQPTGTSNTLNVLVANN